MAFLLLMRYAFDLNDYQAHETVQPNSILVLTLSLIKFGILSESVSMQTNRGLAANNLSKII